MMTRAQFKDMLATLLGGHAAEETIFNEITTGSQNDIEQATRLARKMVTDFGMSEKLGPRTFGQKEELVFLGREISEQRDYSDKVAEQIDDEVHDIIQQAHEVARKILTDNRPKLIQIAEKLITQETIEGEELDELFNAHVSEPSPETKEKPISPLAKTNTRTKPVSKKTSGIVQRPKQAPATS